MSEDQLPATVDAGTSASAALNVGPFDVSDVRFSPDQHLVWHAHPRACVAVVLAGAVRKEFSGVAVDATKGVVVTMPALERHEDLFGHSGTRILVVEHDLVQSRGWFRDWGATLIAIRAAQELALGDEFTPLALEGLALELVAVAARGRPLPPETHWLRDAYDELRDRFLDPPSTAELATHVGVHPAHLARAFRLRYGDSPGGFVRRCRLEWAAERLIATEVPLACLAAEAGFADQSHFTRAFRRVFGITPASYRRALR
jgi:AraC family transcriptional regulator